jgi:hypothetical protein
MTITHDWHIANLEYEIEDGFVYTAHWIAEASDGSLKSSAYGSLGLSRPDNLIPYESLTEEIVVSWVKEKFSEVLESEDPEAEPKKSRLQQIEEGLAAQIESQKHPKTDAGLPWVKEEEPPAEELNGLDG